jgi:hypothetical protein
MAKSNFNYAGPGARVGIQAGNVVITGGLKVGGTDDDDIQVGGISVFDDDDEDED